jgi:hypothetical protein
MRQGGGIARFARGGTAALVAAALASAVLAQPEVIEITPPAAKGTTGSVEFPDAKGTTGSIEFLPDEAGPSLTAAQRLPPPPVTTPLTPPPGGPTIPNVPFTGPPFYRPPVDAPLGYTGRSGIVPRDIQTDNHFVPVEDRWRIGFPSWDRYGKGYPLVDDYPYTPGRLWDPYGQNVLKGDYPIIGQHTFFVLTGQSRSLFEFRQVPIPTTPFESTANPRSYPFFGRPDQFVYLQYFALGLDLFHGDAAFKPVDWRLKVTPIFNINYLAGQELAVVNPDVRRGVDRGRTFLALEEWFFETKILDSSPNYDFVSARIGSQPFTSDFRGFIFSDTNRAVRIFGARNSNRQQFNLALSLQQEKDTNSFLNTFNDRHQRVLIGNYYVQDFVFPGYTSQWSVIYNRDEPTFKFDKNDFLVRPDPVGVFQPHGLDVAYLGWTGDGHIDRINVNHAFYWALGHDSLNPLANRPQDINAQMAALELSYDRDWVRFRSSYFWSSGDSNPRNGHATGFDGVFDNPNFAGGQFSYWQRQAVRLLGVNLTNRESLFPNLRSSKFQGQSNFVNPGLHLANAGADIELTPRWRLIANANFLWFDNTETLKTFVFQEKINRFIGTDLSLGTEYRPRLNNNVVVLFGAASLIPGQGFKDLYSNIRTDVGPMFSVFMDVALTY